MCPVDLSLTNTVSSTSQSTVKFTLFRTYHSLKALREVTLTRSDACLPTGVPEARWRRSTYARRTEVRVGQIRGPRVVRHLSVLACTGAAVREHKSIVLVGDPLGRRYYSSVRICRTAEVAQESADVFATDTSIIFKMANGTRCRRRRQRSDARDGNCGARGRPPSVAGTLPHAALIYDVRPLRLPLSRFSFKKETKSPSILNWCD